MTQKDKSKRTGKLTKKLMSSDFVLLALVTYTDAIFTYKII